MTLIFICFLIYLFPVMYLFPVISRSLRREILNGGFKKTQLEDFLRRSSQKTEDLSGLTAVRDDKIEA